MLSNEDRARAERSFKKQQQLLEADKVWRELAAQEEATVAKTARLKALRIARDAMAPKAAPKTIKRAK